MNSEQLYRAIGQIDDELLTRYEARRQPKSTYWLKWSSAVAFAAAAVIIAFMATSVWNEQSQIYTASGTVIQNIEGVPSDVLSGSTVAPANGSKVYDAGVQQALTKYAGQDVKYFVAIDLFANMNPVEYNSPQAQAELERLTALNYNVGYATAWTYQGNQQKVNYSYIAGYFTADQLKNFAINTQYGYVFHFATNGDGSPVSADQGIDMNFKK
ncbi:hypothetical protein PQ460_21620 [Paenibacillus sp. KACC 21273]|uniref:hypothetical protein n=1 Tax=Paenibacillus sp. KACC 21273 TaxID=3025665 RepID=UPI0023657CE9|nr:hypothetical protein [Paenibacillus sp. KACC 21273]WDF50539.1 hypothetical protein PQ460_21620 [Paenibacillus sp. KACC 21273]